MSHTFFATELEGVATFWRIHRTDGITLGFTSHDRDLWFDGVLHRAAPGMVPSSIRRTADLADDSADMAGALAHDTVRADELALGRFDEASCVVGAVDWETLERTVLYRGSIGAVEQQGGAFTAALASAKARLDIDPIPRTSPTCRAAFCGPGCGLPASRYDHEGTAVAIDHDGNRVQLSIPDPARFAEGRLRWFDGPQTGLAADIVALEGDWLVLGRPIDLGTAVGARVIVREGCDRTIATCAARFGNAANFVGEPFLPGNDFLARYPLPK